MTELESALQIAALQADLRQSIVGHHEALRRVILQDSVAPLTDEDIRIGLKMWKTAAGTLVRLSDLPDLEPATWMALSDLVDALEDLKALLWQRGVEDKEGVGVGK